MEVDPGDGDIVDGVVAGRQGAFGVLYSRHAPVVFRVCARQLGSAVNAEDALSATFLQAWQIHHRALLVEDSLRPWLLAIAVNITRNQTRSERRGVAAWLRSTAGTLDSVDGPETEVVARIGAARDAALLSAGIAQLPERERLVVQLCLLEGLSSAQVAVVLGIPDATVRSRLARARGRLRLLLQQSEHSESGEQARRSGHHQGGRHPVVPAVHDR
jgi:RNA polymerase sigma-70 factor, ECF subfamily